MAFDCKRYSQDDMSDAINLYLHSRNSYRALREILVLPRSNTICNYFGKHGPAGGTIECERTINNVFLSLNDGQKDSFVSFDEIHTRFAIPGKICVGICTKYRRTGTCQHDFSFDD